jgi:hypothetical protein
MYREDKPNKLCIVAMIGLIMILFTIIHPVVLVSAETFFIGALGGLLIFSASLYRLWVKPSKNQWERVFLVFAFVIATMNLSLWALLIQMMYP